MPRRLLMVLAILVLLAVTATLLLVLLLDRQQVIAYATGLLYEKTGATLAVNGEARLALLPALRVSLSDIAITLPDTPRPEVHARSLDFDIQLMPLLSGDIKADSIALDGLVIQRESSTTPADTAPQQPDTAQAHGTAPHVIDLPHITVTDARVILHETDTTTQLSLQNLEASAHYNGRLASPELHTGGSAKGLAVVLSKRAESNAPIISGSANLDWQLRATGGDRSALLTSLDGPITVATESLILHGTSVEHILCQTIALSNQETLNATFSADTHFQPLTATIALAGGRANLQPVQANLPGVALRGAGSLDLRTDVVNAQFVARVSSELEQLDHACRVSKRLTALDWPVECTGDRGTDPSDWCRVDTTQIVQSLMMDEGMEKLEKKASKFLNKLFNRGD